MTVRRVKIPNATRDAVLKEYFHKCALCGANNPQIHHIDCDPSNNEISNLIPLCPNHHLQDQHDPTKPIDPKKLALFRQFKDPAILDTRFHPLFLRMLFLDEVSTESNVDELVRCTQELLDFLSALKMGVFYCKQVGALLKKPNYPRIVQLGNPASEAADHHAVMEHNKQYRSQLISNRSAAVALIIEALRFQSWSSSESGAVGRKETD